MSQRFLETIEKSGLLTKEQIDAFLDQLRKDGAADVIENEQALAEKFVAAGHLTPWQTEKLLQGKHKGFLLGNYKLLRHLGAGGMSSVFLAEHKHMRQRRAIKVLPQHRVNDSSYLGRFYREARAAAALDHPNIVRAYDVDSEGDNHYLVMEFVEGSDIQKLIATQGVLPYETAVEYVRQAALGLAHAHQAGLIHRDIKPANLLVDIKGTVKILDMGLARFADDEKQASLTQVHDENVLGTADYLAPEQAIDSHSVDARADIYSLGCTLYFALTGHPPFPEGTLAQRLLMHQQREPAPIAKVRPDVPKDLVAICKRMMAKSLDERFQSADEVEQALGRWLFDRGGGRGGAFASAGTRGPGGPAAGSHRPGGVQTAQRVLQKAKPAEDSGNRLPAVGDTLAGSGQPTTKGPAGGKSAAGDSSSRLSAKAPVAAKAGDSGTTPKIGPPPAAGKRPGDSSGNFNFNIKTDDSNVLTNRGGKKSAAKQAGDSASGSTPSGKSDPKNAPASKTSAPARGTAPAKPTAPAKKGEAPRSASDSGKGTAEEAPARPKPLRKKTSAKKVIVWGIILFALCIGLVVGLVFAIKHTDAVKHERMRQAEQEALDRENAKKEREQKEAEAAQAALDAIIAPVVPPSTTPGTPAPGTTNPAPAAAPSGS